MDNQGDERSAEPFIKKSQVLFRNTLFTVLSGSFVDEQ